MGSGNKPLFNMDEKREKKNPDGSSTIPSSAGFFPDRNVPEFEQMQASVKAEYGGAKVFTYDVLGKQMGLVIAPGLDQRRELLNVREHYQKAKDADMVKALDTAIKGIKTAPEARP